MGKTELIVEPGKQEIKVRRTFDAPAEMVYRAYTDAGLLRRWIGPRRLEMILCEIDARPGGSWRYVQRDTDGTEYGFHGVYHDLVPGRRIVGTFEFEGEPGHVLLETTILEEHNGKTTWIGQSVFQSVEDRDAMVAAGMEGGMNEGWDRLDDMLLEVQQGTAAAR